MFGFLAALNLLIPKQREGREALIYENDIRTGQGLSKTKIYRETSVDKRARKELAAIRCKERLQQQIKFVRLMKKLLIKVEQNDETDEEFEQMRRKVAQLELKIEKAARAKEINCDDMFDLDKPDDAYDIELEQFIRNTTNNTTGNVETKTINEKYEHKTKISGDNVNIQSSSIVDAIVDGSGDQVLLDRIRKMK